MGPPFWTAVGGFIKAIFVGTAGATTAAGVAVNAGYIFAVNLARVGLLALIAKVTAGNTG